MARLILLNGPPGVGKSTLARRLVDAPDSRPLTLLLDVDVVRALLGADGPDVTRSWLAARALALAMAQVHLHAGHDAVVPQYLGRPEFVRQLAAVARATNAEFVEIVLMIERDAGEARFRARGDVPQLVGATETYGQMHERLAGLLAGRPHTLRVDAGGDEDRTAALLVAALGPPGGSRGPADVPGAPRPGT